MAPSSGARAHIHVAATLIAVILATRLGGVFGFPPTGISTFWPPNAILLASLLMMDAPHRKRCFLLAYPAYVATEVWIGFSFISSLIFAAANCLEVLVALSLVRRFGHPAFDLGHLRQSLVILLAITVASPVGALIGAAGVWLSDGPFGETFLRWFLADFIGFLVFVPLILTLPAWRDWLRSAPTSARVEAALAAATLLVLSLTVYGPTDFWGPSFHGSQYLPIPVMLWAALRFGPKGAAVSSFGVSLVAISYAINGFGPFSYMSPESNVESLQFFITSLVFATIAVAVLTKERDSALTGLAQSRDDLKALIEERTGELVVSQDRFRTLVESAPVCIHEIDREGKLISMNAAGLRMMGAEKEAEICGMNYIDVPVPEDRARVADLMDRAWRGQGSEFEFRAAGKAGLLYFSSSFEPIKDDEGNVARLMGVTADITELRQAEEGLRNSRDILRALADNLPEFISLKDPEGRFLFVNKRFEELVCVDRDDVVGKTVHDIYSEDQAAEFEALDQEAIASRSVVSNELDLDYPDGSTRAVVRTRFPLISSDGGLLGLGTINVDVSEHKRAEERLRQAQKMEAIGQLTGGVAHDFNNLLAIIQGNAELLAAKSKSSDPKLQAIIRSSERGAGLTQRLLAFARQQPLHPQPVDLAELMAGMSALLKPALGETTEIVTALPSNLWPAMADPAQLEDAVLNLAINARDAMPQGGRLTIECTNASLDEAYVEQNPEVAAGDYVLITVSDTGVGMSDAVREHAFEPFFTTREVGKGSGLGLSMVYGFAKQSGGHVTIESELGRGTKVRLYLPRAEHRAEAEAEKDSRDEPRGGSETVLVVEDNLDVRDMAVAILEDLGYRTLEAAEAASAMALLANGEQVDLLLCDVVLPGGVNGPEFAETAQNDDPRLKVIFMSGYPAKSRASSRILGSREVLLNKPFKRSELAAALREALDH